MLIFNPSFYQVEAFNAAAGGNWPYVFELLNRQLINLEIRNPLGQSLIDFARFQGLDDIVHALMNPISIHISVQTAPVQPAITHANLPAAPPITTAYKNLIAPTPIKPTENPQIFAEFMVNSFPQLRTPVPAGADTPTFKSSTFSYG